MKDEMNPSVNPQKMKKRRRKSILRRFLGVGGKGAWEGGFACLTKVMSCEPPGEQSDPAFAGEDA